MEHSSCPSCTDNHILVVVRRYPGLVPYCDSGDLYVHTESTPRDKSNHSLLPVPVIAWHGLCVCVFVAIGFSQSMTNNRIVFTTVVWLTTVGVALIVSCIIAKLLRLYIMFKYAIQIMRAITLKEMLVIVGIVFVIEIALLGVWTEFSYARETVWLSVTCTFAQQTLSLYFLLVLVGFNLALCLVSVIFAVMTRSLPSNFNESQMIHFTVIVTCVVAVVILPISLIQDIPLQVRQSVLTVGMAFVAYFVSGTLFISRVYLSLVTPTPDHAATGNTTTNSDDIAMFVLPLSSRRSSSEGEPLDARTGLPINDLTATGATVVLKMC